jgi:predicted site-specific integrase-resolvase
VTTKEPEPALINTRQAAAILGVSHATALRWARNGKLPVHTQVPGYRGPMLFDQVAVTQLREQLDREGDDTEALPPAG